MIVASLVVPTGCLILAVVSTSFLVGMAVMGVILVSHGNPRVDQLTEQLSDKDSEILELQLDLDIAGASATSTRKINFELLGEAVARIAEIGDLQTKIAELESERRAYDLTVANCDHLRVENERLASQLLKPDNEQAVSNLAKLVYQGWHRCNEAANGQFSGYYSKPFVTADGEYELIYRRRGSLGVAGGEPTLASVIDEAFCHANRMTERTA